MENTLYVFVYGTLRVHEGNHSLLRDAKCVARHAWTNGVLYDTGVGYPAMATDPMERVYGEVYEITKEHLRCLDQLEGFAGDGEINHYERIDQTVYTDHGPLQAYVYVYLPHQVKDLVAIPSGDWKCHRYLAEEDLYYFAYGSCMDDKRMEVAGVKEKFTIVIGGGVARNYSLAYTRQAADGGRADMVESHDSVEGKVYRIDQDALHYLFQREGVNAHIYRPAFIDVKIDGLSYKNVVTFLVIDKEEEVAPPVHYAIEILRGAQDFVSVDYYRSLLDDLNTKFQMKLEGGHF